jgi:hypothetical protein
MPMLASYEEIDSPSPVELCFRQACQFYVLFKEHHGPSLDPLDTRLFWMCHADGFLMTLVSLKELVNADQEMALNGSDLFRMMTVVRNVTVHDTYGWTMPAGAFSPDGRTQIGSMMGEVLL